jgi:hypothetical protein
VVNKRNGEYIDENNTSGITGLLCPFTSNFLHYFQLQYFALAQLDVKVPGKVTEGTM